MVRSRRIRSSLALALVLLAASLLAGCAAKKACTTPAKKIVGHDLAYRMPEGTSLRYRMSSAMTQTVSFQGQSSATETTSATELAVNSSGLKDDAYRLTVTIESMDVQVHTPEGTLAPDLSSVSGQSFDMGLTPLGEEVDFPGPDVIQYGMGESRKQSAISALSMMFPDVAGKPVEIGDTWITTDGVTDKSEESEMALTFESVNTLAGFETVDGYECARITTVFTGTIRASGKEGPADVTSEGDLEGTSVWHFAHKEGILVSDVTEGTGTMMIHAVTPQGEMEIPATLETQFGTRIIP